MPLELSNRLSVRLNTLSVAVASALTGLIVFYLPDLVQRPFDWRIEGHLIGLTLALLGAVAVLMSARALTRRDSFRSWAMAVLTGAVAGALLAVIRNVSMPRWLALASLIVSVTLIITAIYALILGFAQLFDPDQAVMTMPRRTGESSGHGEAAANPRASAEARRKLNWYERLTLLVATVAAVATVVAAAATLLPASSS